MTRAAEPSKVGHEEESRLSFAIGGHVATVEEDLMRAHAFAALAALLVSALFGTIVAIKLVQPDFLAGAAWSTWGSLRASHTQGIMFGWLGNAFLAFLYFAIPRLAGRPVMSRRLGWWLLALWNLAMLLPGWALLAANLPQPWLAIKPLEWTEFPLAVNAVTELCLLLTAVQFIAPLASKPNDDGFYVSSWYVIGGLVFTLLFRWAVWCRKSCQAPSVLRSVGCGFTTRWACTSPRWRWQLPTTCSRCAPGGQSTATSCR